MSQPNFHTQSQPPVQDFNPGDSSFFNVTGEQLPQVIREGKVAVIIFVTQTGRVVSMYSPVVTTDEYNNDFAIQGSLVDDKSVRRFARVELSSLGPIVSFTTRRPTHFSTGVEITGLNGTSAFGRRTVARFTPNFIVVPYQQTKIPSGQIENEEILSLVENWSPPAATILDSILSLRQKYEETLALQNQIVESNREDELFLPGFTEQRMQLVHAFPCVDLLCEGEDEIDPILLQRFVPPPLQQPAPVIQPAPVAQPAPAVPVVQPAPAQPVLPPVQPVLPPVQPALPPVLPPAQQTAVVWKANEEKNLIELSRLSLLFVCGDTTNVQPNTLSLPQLSNGFIMVTQQPTNSARVRMLESLLETTGDNYKNTKGAVADMDVRDDAFNKALLGGCFSGDPYDLNPTSPGSAELNLLSFGPQKNDLDKVTKIKEKKKRVEAEMRTGVPDSQRSAMSSLIPTFENINSVDDVLIVIDNFKMNASAIIAKAQVPMQAPMIIKLFNEFDDFLTSRHVKDWLEKYATEMPWVHAAIMVRLQSIYGAFAKFSRSFLPFAALEANHTNAALQSAVGSDDIQLITGASATLRQFTAAVKTAIAGHSALSAETYCPQSERTRLGMFDASGQKRPVSASAAAGREQVLGSNQGQGVASQQPYRGNANQGQGNATQQPYRGNPYRSNQRQRNQYQRNVGNQAPNNKPPTQLGIFYLANANVPNEQIFPQNAVVYVNGQYKKPCADFTCFGKECLYGRDCRFAHPTNYGRFDQQTFDSICQHFVSTEVGWLNAGMLDKQRKITLANRFMSLRGDESGKFNTQG